MIPVIEGDGPGGARVTVGREFDSDLNVYVPKRVNVGRAAPGESLAVVSVALGENFMVVLGEVGGKPSSREEKEEKEKEEDAEEESDDDDYFGVAKEEERRGQNHSDDDDGVDSKTQAKGTARESQNKESDGYDMRSPPPTVVEQTFSLCRNNRVHELTDFLNRGFNVNAQDSFGNTLLIVAAQNGITWAGKSAVRSGADLNAQNKGGNTALHFAMYYKHADFEKFLLAEGANDEICNKEGTTCWEGLRRYDLDAL